MDIDLKSVLIRYLGVAREAVMWKVADLGPYELRKPFTPTGTNLGGVVRHLTMVEAGYLGGTFGRPWPRAEVFDFNADPQADMWVPADMNVDEVIASYRDVWVHSDQTIAELGLDATGTVPWWGEAGVGVSLGRIMVHVIAETERHAGHLDIGRELLDGRAGLRPDNANLGLGDDVAWQANLARIDDAANAFRP